MGKPSANATDQARRRVSGTISASGASADTFTMSGDWNLTMWAGAAAGGVVKLQRSFDGGSNWMDCTAGGAIVALSVPASSSVSEVIREPEDGVLYRLNCTTFTATFSWRASQ